MSEILIYLVRLLCSCSLYLIKGPNFLMAVSKIPSCGNFIFMLYYANLTLGNLEVIILGFSHTFHDH